MRSLWRWVTSLAASSAASRAFWSASRNESRCSLSVLMVHSEAMASAVRRGRDRLVVEQFVQHLVEPLLHAEQVRVVLVQRVAAVEDDEDEQHDGHRSEQSPTGPARPIFHC